MSLWLCSLIFYPHDWQMISYQQVWSLYLLLTDVCVSREVSLGCILIQMAHRTQESLTPSFPVTIPALGLCPSDTLLWEPGTYVRSEHGFFPLPPHPTLWLLPINQFIPAATPDIVFESCSPDAVVLCYKFSSRPSHSTCSDTLAEFDITAPGYC